MGGEGGKVYSLSELASHNSKNDCWILVDGKVYDVTKFLDDHPGGDEVLLLATGKDASDDFADVGHGSTAYSMMSDYYVGDIDILSIPAKVKSIPSVLPPPKKQGQAERQHLILKLLLQYLLPIIILGLAFGVGFDAKSKE